MTEEQLVLRPKDRVIVPRIDPSGEQPTSFEGYVIVHMNARRFNDNTPLMVLRRSPRVKGSNLSLLVLPMEKVIGGGNFNGLDFSQMRVVRQGSERF